MKFIYTIVLVLLIFIMSANVLYVWKKQTKYEKTINRLMASGIVASIFYILFMNSKTMDMALLFDGLYFFMCDVMCYLMLKFIEEYTELLNEKTIQDYIAIGIIVFEAGMFAINNRTHHIFTLEEKMYKTEFSYFTENFGVEFYLHLFFCYVMVALSFMLLIYKIRHTENMYRNKYILVFIPFVLLIAINAVCYNFGLPIDASVALYGVVSTIISFCSYAVIPNQIVVNAQNYIFENISSAIVCFDSKDNCIFRKNMDLSANAQDGKVSNWEMERFFVEKKNSFAQQEVNEIDWEEDLLIDNVEYITRMRFQRILDKKKQRQGYFFIVEDCTDRIRKEREEKYRADYDILTGLYSKTKFFMEADRLVQEDPQKRKILIVSDIRNFKLINNIFGESFGDDILCKQARLIRKFEKEDTICGRITGDKFAMLTFAEDFDKMVFLDAIRELENYTMSKKYKICYHVGIYDITGLNEPVINLYNLVNLALSTIRDDYERVFIECTDKVIKDIVQETDTINYFNTALEENQFQMYLQPQVNTYGRAVGAEALVRWHHPVKGIVFPDQFIETFEKAGIIHKLDLYIWDKAGEKLAEWKKKGHEDCYISVNISTKDFYYLNVYEELVKIVENYQLAPKMLKLEITESALMMDQNTGFEIIRKLRGYGFEVEIDDFGSGYSSLNMLKEVHVDVLKIDRVFLRETEDRRRSRIILESVISMAKQMGLSVVTEGVESEEQVRTLTELGSDIFQGYYFDKPITVEQFERKYMKLG